MKFALVENHPQSRAPMRTVLSPERDPDSAADTGIRRRIRRLIQYGFLVSPARGAPCLMGTPRRPAGRRGRLIAAWQKGMAWQKARGSGVGVDQAGAMADQVGPGWTNGQKKRRATGQCSS